MFSANDNNAIRLLSLITDVFMDSVRPKPNIEASKVTEKTRKLWDSLSSVWVLAVVNPELSLEKKSDIKRQLDQWDREQEGLSVNQVEDQNGLGLENVFKMPLQSLSWTQNDTEGIFHFASSLNNSFVKFVWLLLVDLQRLHQFEFQWSEI